MAKALLGHLGGPDPRTVSEMRRLHTRVRQLEAQVADLQRENDALSAALHRRDLLSLDVEQNELVGTGA